MLLIQQNLRKMANKTTTMSKIRQILRLHTQGVSKKKISLLTGTTRNTVKKYLQKFNREQFTFDTISAMSDYELSMRFSSIEDVKPDPRLVALQQLFPDIEKQLKRQGVTLTMLWEQYKSQHPDGYGHTQFYRYYRLWANQVKPVMHIEHKAGDKMYVDFAGKKLSITDPDSGEVNEVEVFAAILGCSQLTYVEAVLTQKKEDFIQCCENALHYFGGVPAAIVPDNLKSAVTKSSKYEPVINESFASFAEHYSTAVIPARSYRPKDKSLVEGIVKISYTRIYAEVSKHIYHSLEALNKAIQMELEKHNNKAFIGRDYSRRQQFEEIEKPVLLPLPAYRFELHQQTFVTVMKNGHVCLGIDKHYYSVPYQHIGKKVKLLYTSARAEIFYNYERIASHARDYRRHQYTTTTEHLATAHRYLSDWTPGKFIEQAAEIDEEVKKYIEAVLETKLHPEQAYKSCSGILNMARKVGKERLVNACKRANSYEVYNYPIIVQILEKNLDHYSDEEKEQLHQMPPHENIRGSEYYQ